MNTDARLKQVAVLVEDLEAVDGRLRDDFGWDEGHHEPGLAMFGLRNTVMPVGNEQFLEITTPLQDEPGPRRVGGRRGFGGYMVIVQVGTREDLEDVRKRLAQNSLRVVHTIEQDDYVSLHVHPKDLGTIVSFDWCGGEWPGTAPHWREHVRTEVVRGIRGVELRSADPVRMARRWAAVLDLPVDSRVLTLPGDGSVVRFADGRTSEDAGLDVVDLWIADRSRAGEEATYGAVQFRLV